LSGVRKSGNGWSARCPAHEDRRASLSIGQGDDGRVLVKCHAGCETSAVLAAIGLTLADLFPPKGGPTPTRNGKPASGGRTFATAEEAVAELERRHGKRSALWTYRDAQGKAVGLVVRWDRPNGKDIRPVSRHADGWRIGAMPEPRPLYRLPELTTASRVVVGEGEKTAEAARSLGFTATTSAGGSQAADKTDWRPLAGKEVWILPDNDAPGRQYAETVAQLGHAAGAANVRILDLAAHAPGLPAGGDLADVLAAEDWCGLPLGDAAEPKDLAAWIEQLAATVEPWQPAERPGGPDALEFRPFPVDVLPEPVRGFVAAGARAIGCDPSFLALPLLTALAAAIGNTRRLELKRGWLVPPILWGAVVGESGTAKTAAFRLVIRPVRERQRKALERHAEEVQRYEADLARWERDLAAWKRAKDALRAPPAKPDPPQAERCVVSDTTVEALAPLLRANPRGLLLARDELAGWIGSFDRYAKGRTGADAAHWLSLFNAEDLIIDRKTGVPRTLHVPQAAVCVFGGIQPAVLRRVLGLEHRESGLAARLLLAWPPRKVKRWTEADIDPDAEAELVRLFDRLYELRPTVSGPGEARPVLVRLSSEAKRAWTEYYNAHALEQADLSGDLASAWSKLEEYAARLALVVHHVRWAAGDVADELWLDAGSMHAGIALAEWFKQEARRVYAMLDESDPERDQRRLVEWISRKGGAVTPREVQGGCRWLRAPGAAEAALEELVEAGRGSWQNVPTTGQGGRPTRAFVLCRHVDMSTKPPDSKGSCRRNLEISRENGGFVDVDTVDAPKIRGCVDAASAAGETETSARKGGLFDLLPDGPYGNGF
jgi:hypothetical protein